MGLPIVEDYQRIVPDAFHGTGAEGAEGIRKGGFRKSVGRHQFLGDGVYFYESSQWAAEEWARIGLRQGTISPPLAVFRAVINLGRCLDYHNKRHRNFVKGTAVRLSMKTSSPVFDADVIDLITTKLIPNIDTVRAPYANPEWGTVFPGSKFLDFTEIIICVVNPASILTYSEVIN